MPRDAATSLVALADRYLQALLSRDRDEASRLVSEALAAGTPLADLYTGVFRPSQRELGRLWQVDRVSIAQEHYCTAATQMIMSRLYAGVFSAPRRGTQLLAATVTGNLHELGIRMVVDLFELAGWDTVYLGAQTPEVIQAAVIARRPPIVALSAALPMHLPAVERVVRALRAEPACAGTLITVGGRAFHSDPELWRRIGADGSAEEAEGLIAWADQRVSAVPGMGG
jgi:methanogenic corrinoid protein MtbC1